MSFDKEKFKEFTYNMIWGTLRRLTDREKIIDSYTRELTTEIYGYVKKCSPSADPEIAENFIEKYLKLKDGETISKNRAYLFYVSFCINNNLKPFPKIEFGKKVSKNPNVKTVRKTQKDGKRVYCWKLGRAGT